MWTESFVLQYHQTIPSQLHCDSTPTTLNQQQPVCVFPRTTSTRIPTLITTTCRTTRLIVSASSSSSLFNNPQPLDLTEDNVREVLADARQELAQLFDQSVGMTGEVDLAELDGPFVKISLKGRFWHKRSTVVERLGNYLKQRIPEILEVDIEDEKQLDDSPASF